MVGGNAGIHLDRGNLRREVLTLVFLPALYAIWFKIKSVAKDRQLVFQTASVPGEMERRWVGAL
jgi:hypothetical protein